MAMTISTDEFAAAFKGFMEQMGEQAPASEPGFFPTKLTEHFGKALSRLTALSEKIGGSAHPNLQLAIDEYVTSAGRTFELYGIASESPFLGVSISQLTGPSEHNKVTEGPVAYSNVALDGDRSLACVALGLYLICDGERRLAIMVQKKDIQFGTGLTVDVLADDRALANECLATLRTVMRKRNVYRGHVVSLAQRDNELAVNFHRLPKITREQIVLPQGLLDRIERQTIGFGRHAERLLAAGRHLKRGMLLHGLPGTGKTLTAMYLASQMPERTVLLVTGRSVGMIEQACQMARVLQPATVVLEDVDLIAEDRSRQNNSGAALLLFELLNQMDGLADDADILFVLTTNRADLLEPALATRPGRIDLALEVPLPDADCRRRLLELYGRGLDIATDITPYIERTKGASAAFIRELLRKAALIAADDGEVITVKARHLDDALHEMVVQGGDLTKSLLGAARDMH